MLIFGQVIFSNPRATALGVKDSILLFVNSEYETYKGDNMEIFDLEGKLINPGFMDNLPIFSAGDINWRLST